MSSLKQSFRKYNEQWSPLQETTFHPNYLLNIIYILKYFSLVNNIIPSKMLYSESVLQDLQNYIIFITVYSALSAKMNKIAGAQKSLTTHYSIKKKKKKILLTLTVHHT